MEALLDAGLRRPPTLQNVLVFLCKTDGGPMEALLDAGLRRPPTLLNVLVFPCKIDGGPMEALLDAGLRGPPTLQNVLVFLWKTYDDGAKSNSNLELAPVCYRRVRVQVVVCWLLIIAMLPYPEWGHRWATGLVMSWI